VRISWIACSISASKYRACLAILRTPKRSIRLNTVLLRRANRLGTAPVRVWQRSSRHQSHLGANAGDFQCSSGHESVSTAGSAGPLAGRDCSTHRRLDAESPQFSGWWPCARVERLAQCLATRWQTRRFRSGLQVISRCSSRPCHYARLSACLQRRRSGLASSNKSALSSAGVGWLSVAISTYLPARRAEGFAQSGELVIIQSSLARLCADWVRFRTVVGLPNE
jgi:hypothetical protein